MTDPANDAAAQLADALAAQAHADALHAAAADTADAPVPQLTAKARQSLVAKYAGREVDFVRRFGIGLWRTLSYRQIATLRGVSAKRVWLGVQAARVPRDVFDELLETFSRELPEHQHTAANLLTKIVDEWRLQNGQKAIRDASAPTHCCPNCGHRW